VIIRNSVVLPAPLGPTKPTFSPFWSAAIALSIYQGAFIAEDLRGGMQSVGRGQSEAGLVTGLTSLQIFRFITLPQAVRAIIPALVNRYINLFLYTSVASVVGVLEFTRASILVSNRLMVHPIEIFGQPYTVVGVMPPGVAFPEGTQIWLPIPADPASERHSDRRYTGAVGRLAPGATLHRSGEEQPSPALARPEYEQATPRYAWTHQT